MAPLQQQAMAFRAARLPALAPQCARLRQRTLVRSPVVPLIGAQPSPIAGALTPMLLLRRDTRARAAATPAEPDKPAGGVVPKMLDVFKVFTDPACNKKLLALAIGQMLCSVATLMHDSYLPVYVQDELGLSSTKVRGVC